MSNKKYRIIADPTSSAMLLTFAVIGSGLCFHVIVDALIETDFGRHYTSFMRTATDFVGVVVMFFVLWLLLMVTCFLLAKQMCVRITFTENAVTIHPLFSKPVQRAYKYYPYVYKGGYWHGSAIGVGKWVDYIVFSHGYIKKDDLLRINTMGKDTDVIRIRYRKKNYDKLLAALPTEMAYKVKVCFPES